MAWIPRTTRSEKDGNRIRLYASPRFATFEGKLQPLRELPAVTHDPATASYRVTLPNGHWLAWTPRVRPGGLLKRAVVTPTHFGDVLDSLADPILDYDVTFSRADAVEYTPDGWRFKAIEDVPIGIFFGDLERNFPGRITHKSDGSVRIDLTGVAADSKGEWNLDPSPFAPASQSGSGLKQTAPTWNQTIGPGTVASAMDNVPGPLRIYAAQLLEDQWNARRVFLKFDTSDLPDGAVIDDATLHCMVSSVEVGGTDGVVCFSMADWGVLDTFDWGETLGTNHGQEGEPAADEEDQWTIASGDINKTGNTCLTLRESDYDAGAFPPPEGTGPFGCTYYDVLDEDAPWLEVSLVNTAPSQPANLVEDDNTSTTADLSWDASTDTEEDTITYRVQWVVNGAGWGAPSEDTTQNTSLTITGLTKGTTYDVRVRAEDEAPLTSNWNTQPALFTTNAAPPIVTGLAAGPRQPTTAVLAWDVAVDPEADPVTYRIQWVETEAGWGGTPAETTTQNLTTTLTGLKAGGRQVYDVRIRSEDDESPPLVSSWATHSGLVTTIAPSGRGMRMGVGR